MFDFQKILYSRFSWFSLFIIGLCLIVFALYFQEVKELEPCFLCINQRLSIFIIMFGALIGLLKPKNKVLMGAGFFFWLLGSIYGLGAAIYQVYLQRNPTPSFSCTPDMDYLIEIKGYWEAFNILLDSPGSCSDIQWVFLGLSMPEWMVVIFSIFMISCFVFIKQFIFKKNNKV